MIVVICYCCGDELTELGGLLLSPPDRDDIKKYHLCRGCFGELMEQLKGWGME